MVVSLFQIRLRQPNAHRQHLMPGHAITLSPSGVQSLALFVDDIAAAFGIRRGRLGGESGEGKQEAEAEQQKCCSRRHFSGIIDLRGAGKSK